MEYIQGGGCLLSVIYVTHVDPWISRPLSCLAFHDVDNHHNMVGCQAKPLSPFQHFFPDL